jgi:hypothetical protein
LHAANFNGAIIGFQVKRHDLHALVSNWADSTIRPAIVPNLPVDMIQLHFYTAPFAHRRPDVPGYRPRVEIAKRVSRGEVITCRLMKQAGQVGAG